MSQLVIGLDVCKDSVVGCALKEHDHREPRQLYRDLEFHKLYANVGGIRKLLDLGADVAVLEPTGTNYSKIWAIKLAENGVKVVLVGHKQLRSFRENLGLPDKDDFADSLALALYYIQHQQLPERFVCQRDPVIAQIRDMVLRLHHLNRCQSPIVNRIRQDLAWQFPEMAKASLDAAVFWGWLAGNRKSVKYDSILADSVGLGLHPETRNAAKALAAIHGRELELEREMRSLLSDARFLKYRKVFARFGFGERVEALMLSQIYPLENYLGQDGTPIVEFTRAKNSANNQKTKKYISLRRFQKALGVAPMREDSGDRHSTQKAGSSLCRTALWQWIFTRIEIARCRPKNEIGLQLAKIFDYEKSHKPIKLARSRTAAKAAQLLFKKLVEELCK